MLDGLLERFRQRDRLALSRLITLASRGEYVVEIRAALGGESSGAPVVAITGSAGVGKSTLIGRLVKMLSDQGKSVAVFACDPQSPLTGGALLGDRVRMQGANDNVFIRSLATPSGQQAVAHNIDLLTQLACAFGFDVVLLETIGAGQGDTVVRDLADVVVVLLQPESGDELQWQKAGLLEIADVVVIHKSDLPGAERVQAEVRDQLNLPGCRPVPVIAVSAQKSQGLDELWETIETIHTPVNGD